MVPIPPADDLYLIQNERLFRVDDDTGAASPWSGKRWATATSMTTLGRSIYVISQENLWKLDPTNSASLTLLGATRDLWDGPSLMTSLQGWVYAIQVDYLHYVNVGDGSYGRLGPPIWTDAAAFAACGDWLYIVQDERLWRVDSVDGERTQLGEPQWGGSALLTSHANRLYAIHDGYLSLVDTADGTRRPLGQRTWTDATAITALPGDYPEGGLFVVQGGQLYKVRPSDGDAAPLGAPEWADVRLMTFGDAGPP